MKRLLLLALVFAAPLFGEPVQRYLVTMRPAAAASRPHIVANAEFAAAHHVRAFRHLDAFAADLTPGEAAALRQLPEIAGLAPVVERQADALELPQARLRVAPNLDYLNQTTPWGVPAIHADQVWPVTRGENVNVAVLDTGIDVEHPDLVHAYAGGYNVVAPGTPPIDDNMHGTHVSGTIAAADNTFGIVGVAPAVRLWAVKVLDSRGNGTDETVAAGIDWVIEQVATLGGRWVINMSLSSGHASEVEEMAVANALSHGIVLVASAGNRSTPFVRYPARYRGVIAVGAVDEEFERAEFSSYGAGLTVMGPGVAIPSTMPRGFAKQADVRYAGDVIDGWGVDGSPLDVVSGTIVDCGLGRPQDFPAGVAGSIALVYRGEIPFREKSRNAKDAGATAVIIWDNDLTESIPNSWSMKPLNGDDPAWETYPFLLTIGVTRSTGIRLLGETARITAGYRTVDYGTLNGTSMSAPHVAGVAALMLAVAPGTAALQVKYAIEHSALDLDAPGLDFDYAWGMVDALAAAKFVAPEVFGVEPPVPTPSTRRRGVR